MVETEKALGRKVVGVRCACGSLVSASSLDWGAKACEICGHYPDMGNLCVLQEVRNKRMRWGIFPYTEIGYIYLRPIFNPHAVPPSKSVPHPVPSWMLEALNRRVGVEQEMLDTLRDKIPLPDKNKLREWTVRLGVPKEYWKDVGIDYDETALNFQRISDRHKAIMYATRLNALLAREDLDWGDDPAVQQAAEGWLPELHDWLRTLARKRGVESD